jgi:hypothetical protein
MYVKWWSFNPLKTMTMTHNAMSGRMESACHMQQKERDCNAAQCHKLITSSKTQRQLICLVRVRCR